MKRLHIYVIKAFLGPFFMTFFICIFVLLMQFLWKYVDDMVGKGLEWSVIGEVIFYASFGLLPLAFPLSILIASIMTFGSLGENYELVAIKSSGISLFRVMRPLIVLAIFISCTAFYFANYIVPVTNKKLYALMISVKEQKPELILKEGVFTNEIDGYSIRVEKRNKKTNMLYDVMIYDHTNQRANEGDVTVADSGFMRMTADKKYMVLTLYHGKNYREEPNRNRRDDRRFPRYVDEFDKQILNIELKNFDFNRKDESIYTNNYRMLRIRQLKAVEDSMQVDYRRRVKNFINQLSLNVALHRRILNQVAEVDSLKRDWDLPVDTLVDVDQMFASFDDFKKKEIMASAVETVRRNHQNTNSSERSIFERKKIINRHEMERHKKFTLSLAVLIFFFIGAPLGAIIRKGGLGMPVVVSILLFIIYYILSLMGEKSAREDLWDMVVGMWFSSAVFIAIGIWLTYKAVTDSGIMSSETYADLFRKFKMLRIFRKKLNADEALADNQ
ncbi:MAG: LptF/LptG family permease [Prolixibacteraceae bacterium]|nr:LptF/LptG family permease [Prolixibacteraceae bacterium]